MIPPSRPPHPRLSDTKSPTSAVNSMVGTSGLAAFDKDWAVAPFIAKHASTPLSRRKGFMTSSTRLILTVATVSLVCVLCFFGVEPQMSWCALSSGSVGAACSIAWCMLRQNQSAGRAG